MEIQVVHHGVGDQKKQRDVDDFSFSTLEGCRVEMLNSGLLGWMPKSNLAKILLRFVSRMCCDGDVFDQNGSKNTAWCFENFGSGK